MREEDEARVRAAWEKAEAERREAEERKARRDAARRWRVLMSAVWTRISLREEFGEDGDARAFEGGWGRREDGARGAGRGREGWGRAREDDRGVAGAAARIAEPSKRRRSEMIAGGSGKMAIVEGGAVADVEEM